MNVVFLVVDVPDHHNCGKLPKLCDPIAIYSSERKAWERCKEIGEHSIAYCGPVELDKPYDRTDAIKTHYPNCPMHSHPEPAAELAGLG
jgi:hypothetical protein